MVNYNRTEQGFFLNRSARTKPVKRITHIPIFMLLLFFGLFLIPAFASAMDKVVVIPFMVKSTESEENLNITLQKWFSTEMSALGYEVSNPELVNNALGENISYSEPEKQIIPLARANAAKWVIIGEYNHREDDIQLSARVLDPDTGKSPFTVMMVENNKNNIPASLKKIAESLNSQMDKKSVVSDIIIEGNKRVGDDAILMIMESQKGEPFDQVKLDRDLRTIYKMGFFDDVNLITSDSPDGKVITFNLVEKPTIIKISFQGNEKKKDDKLKEELGLKAYSVLNLNDVRQSINRLTEFYKNAGYYNVDIQEKIKELPDNEVTLTYVINEGEKVLISKIEFRGNKVFKNKKLKKEMLTKEKGWLSWFTDSGVLDKKKLEYDVNKLAAFYDSHGYVKARVGEPEVVYDKEKLSLVINIVEGEQYFVNDIVFEGDLLRPADELRRLIDIKKGDPFSRQAVHTETQKIKELYGSLGYAYAEVNPSQRVIEGTNFMDIPLTIDKKKKVRIERINISGNEITKDMVLRRELKIKEGEYFDSQQLAKSRENLDRLEIFEKHEVKTRRGTSDDLMVIDIEGVEKLQRSISFSAGYGGYEKFMFQLQFDNNNLFGRGQNFSIEAMAGSRTTRFNATFTEPWMFDRPVRGTISAYNWDRDYDDYTREQMGGNAGLSFLLGLDDYTRGSVFYTYDRTQITDVYTSIVDPIQDIADNKYLTSSMVFGIERNTKDKWWDTTKGSLNSFTFEYAGGPLGGDVAFNKYTLNSTWYLPLFKGTVLVASAQLGYVEGRSGAYLPIYEKFRIGGIDTVRGYEWGTISPLYPGTYIEIGGDKMWLYKIEYRVPFAKGKGITGLVFFDAGNDIVKSESWKKGAGASVGFGIRWYSPMGPMRLEYGIKLKERENDPDSGKFEFKIGGSF